MLVENNVPDWKYFENYVNFNGKKMPIVNEMDWSDYDQMWTLDAIDDDGNYYRFYYHDLGADVELDEYDYDNPSCVEDVSNEYY